METLRFDEGLLELEVNDNGVLRFNASDFNVYLRFWNLMTELPEIEQQYAVEVEQTTGQAEDGTALAGRVLETAHQIDHEIKTRLSAVFGTRNDFDALTGGVNLMAFGNNGERIITNLLNGLKPYMEQGMKKHQADSVTAAVAEAKLNRAQRRVL